MFKEGDEISPRQNLGISEVQRAREAVQALGFPRVAKFSPSEISPSEIIPAQNYPTPPCSPNP